MLLVIDPLGHLFSHLITLEITWPTWPASVVKIAHKKHLSYDWTVPYLVYENFINIMNKITRTLWRCVQGLCWSVAKLITLLDRDWYFSPCCL